ncbi:MAG: N-acetyltransferase [Vicinamibacterales bacterium]
MTASDNVAIVEVTTPDRVTAFIDLPYRMYADDSHWVPPLRRDERHRLSPRNAFFSHADIRLWLAERHGEVVGRIAAIDDRAYNETHRQAITWFGFFESADGKTAAALLTAVESHARQKASVAVYGPVNPSLNESAGLLVEGFDSDPYVLMPHNPAGYQHQIAGAGYSKLKDLFAWHLDLRVPLPERLARLSARVARRSGVTLRTLDKAAFERELGVVLEIYQAAWGDNWGFVPPTEAEAKQLADTLRPIIDPEIVVFAEVDGRAVGCAVAVPDANQVLKRMRGRVFPFGIVHFLRRRSIMNRSRMFLLGVRPEFRHTGLYPLLVAETYQRGRGRYVEGELSWTLEDNDAINAGIEAAGGRHYKTYRLYSKPLCD